MTTNSGLGEEKPARGFDTARGIVAAVLRPIGFVVSPVLRIVAALTVGLSILAAVLVGLADLVAGVFYLAHPSHYPFLVTFGMIAFFLLLAVIAESIRDCL
jgi:hypothetical protein